LSLVAGLIPDALVTRAVRQEQQYQPEGPMLGNRARRSSITGPVGVKVLPDIADRDSAKASVRRMGAQLAQLRRLQDLTAAQTPSGAVVVPVAVPAIMP
jgi:hypothetical protein